MNYQNLILATISLVATQITWAQTTNKDDVRFFEHFFNDAAVVTSAHIEGRAEYADFDKGSAFAFGAQGGTPISKQLDVGAFWSYLNKDRDRGKNESGISDPRIYGRYHLKSQSSTHITVGGIIRLPMGEKKVGQDKTEYGAFAAARMSLNNGVVVMGSIGLNSIEVTKYGTRLTNTGGFGAPSGAGILKTVKTERELSLHIGGGGIFKLTPQTHLIGEVGIDTEEDYFALTSGADHTLSSNSRLRAALTVGLDDGAPDFALRGGYLVNF